MHLEQEHGASTWTGYAVDVDTIDAVEDGSGLGRPDGSYDVLTLSTRWLAGHAQSFQKFCRK